MSIESKAIPRKDRPSRIEDRIEKIKPPLRVVSSDDILVVVAGSDTTATTISALVYYLICDTVAFSRLRAEIDRVFPTR